MPTATKSKILAVSLAALVASTSFSVAQGVPVKDAAALLQAKSSLAKTVAEMAKELEEAKRLYDSINGATNMGNVADMLNNPEIRELLGADFMTVASSISGGIDDLGALKSGALDALASVTVTLEDVSAEDFYAKEVERVSQLNARNAAAGDHILQSADQRLSGLEQLRREIGKASNQKEIDALNARISLESAMLQNDTNRIQGLAMLQSAQDKLEEDRSRAARLNSIQNRRMKRNELLK